MAIQNKSTYTGQKKTDTLNSKVRIEQGNDRLILNDETNNRIILGKSPDGSTSIKLSQPGIDVLTATDEQLIWSSDFNSFKIVSSGTLVALPVTTVNEGVNTNTGFSTTLQPHGLDFTPLIMAFVEVSPSKYTLMPYSETVGANTPSGGLVSSIYRISASSTNIELFHYVVSYSPGIGTGTYDGANVKYYLLRETAS